MRVLTARLRSLRRVAGVDMSDPKLYGDKVSEEHDSLAVNGADWGHNARCVPVLTSPKDLPSRTLHTSEFVGGDKP